MIEAQIAYVLDAVRTRADGGSPSRSATTPRPLGRRRAAGMSRTVWTTGGCASWYLDDRGRNTNALARLHLALPPPDGPLRPRRVTGSSSRPGFPGAGSDLRQVGLTSQKVSPSWWSLS